MSTYIIFKPGDAPFMTKWYQFENHWEPDTGMMVIYLPYRKYTVDGVSWHELESDHL